MPTLPDSIKDEAKSIHSKLLNDQSSDEVAIKTVFHDLGIKEYPHRKAYEELTLEKGAARLIELVLEHVDDSVIKIIKPHLDSGVSLNELVSSDIVGSSAPSIFDSNATIVTKDGKNIVIYVWYDNEYGYSHQVIRLAKHIAKVRRYTYY